MNNLDSFFRQLLKPCRFAFVTVLALAIHIGASSLAYGHPGIGIVRDSRGSVFYTDTANVWRLSPDGVKSIVVTNVHTHELCLDRNENLYGEHLWYTGTTGKWGYYVWRRSADGRVEKIVPDTEGYPTSQSFVRDTADNEYWANREARDGPSIHRRSPDGTQTTLLQSRTFHDIRFLTCSPTGHLYLIDRSDLIQIHSDGRKEVRAERLSGDRFKFMQRHKVQGLCADDNGNVWVAVSENREIKKISKDGTVTIVARSSGASRPNGVFVTTDGHLWILEDSLPGRAKVRHIAPDGTDRTY